MNEREYFKRCLYGENRCYCVTENNINDYVYDFAGPFTLKGVNKHNVRVSQERSYQNGETLQYSHKCTVSKRLNKELTMEH